MKIAWWTAILIYAVVSAVKLQLMPGAPAWACWGVGMGMGATLRILWLEILDSRGPKPPKRPYPTTPR